jgi:acyl-CoA dehydrogenase
MTAHQVHGAMGMSQEYRLGALTTRLWSWTEEAGRPEFWNHYLGQEFLTQPKTSLWESIVNGMKGSNT